jgi:hypothetical protein
MRVKPAPQTVFPDERTAPGITMTLPVAAQSRASAAAAEDVLLAHTELERGAPFCGNPDCALHVRVHDALVEGGGNWITLPDGRMFGRGRFGSRLLCDACGTRRGPVRLQRGRLTN